MKQIATATGVLLTFAVLILGLRHRPRPPLPDPRIPVAELEPWMLRALPGIGPKTCEPLCAAARREGIEALPTPARPAARRVIRF